MAAALSTSTSCSSPLSSFSRPRHRRAAAAPPLAGGALKTLTLSHPPPRDAARCCKPSAATASRTPFLFSHSSRRSPNASLKVAETDPEMINGDEGNQLRQNLSDEMVDQTGFLPMKVLIQAYKKALLDGDEKRISETEVAICVMENEKNDLSLKNTQIISEIASEKVNYLRLKADFENFRKRSEKDRFTFTSDVQGDVIESLLPMVDSFEKAKQQIKPETEKERKIDTSYQGIYKQFVEIMRSLRVSVVETVGRPFDPAVHEAIGREASQQFKEGIVTQEISRGFVLGERLLRPASVKVSTGTGPIKAPSASEKSIEQTDAVVSIEDSVPSS